MKSQFVLWIYWDNDLLMSEKSVSLRELVRYTLTVVKPSCVLVFTVFGILIALLYTRF